MQLPHTSKGRGEMREMKNKKQLPHTPKEGGEKKNETEKEQRKM